MQWLMNIRNQMNQERQSLTAVLSGQGWIPELGLCLFQGQQNVPIGIATQAGKGLIFINRDVMPAFAVFPLGIPFDKVCPIGQWLQLASAGDNFHGFQTLGAEMILGNDGDNAVAFGAEAPNRSRANKQA
jgi:hypothetical protein